MGAYHPRGVGLECKMLKNTGRDAYHLRGVGMECKMLNFAKKHRHEVFFSTGLLRYVGRGGR